MAIKKRVIKSEASKALTARWNESGVFEPFGICCWDTDEKGTAIIRDPKKGKDAVLLVIDECYPDCDDGDEEHDPKQCLGCIARASYTRLKHPKIVKNDLRLPVSTRLSRGRR